MLTYFVEIERRVSRLRAVESCFEERRPAIVHRQTRAALVVLSHIIYRPIAVTAENTTMLFTPTA